MTSQRLAGASDEGRKEDDGGAPLRGTFLLCDALPPRVTLFCDGEPPGRKLLGAELSGPELPELPRGELPGEQADGCGDATWERNRVMKMKDNLPTRSNYQQPKSSNIVTRSHPTTCHNFFPTESKSRNFP